jgi:hypothetical protein
MRDFSKVSPQVWASERFNTLAGDGARLAYLYLLSNGHQNSIGCYRLPVAYACADMGWGPEKYVAALKALIAAELVEADQGTREILILRWFRHNPPTNTKHAMGAFRLVAKVAAPRLREVATEALQAAWDKWQDEHPAGTVSPGSVSRSALLDTPRMRAVANGR